MSDSDDSLNTSPQRSSERRLAAIIAADAVGYSARVAADETAALRALKGCFEVMELAIGLHGGRVVKTMGDGLLIEFGSVVNAVSAALAVRSRLDERRASLPDQDSFAFRLGVHVGDIVADGSDILGDGVNVAARLEAFAEPGQILVSGQAHEHVVGRIELSFSDLGEHALKGIARPVRIYALDAERPNASTVTGQSAFAPALPDRPSVAVLPFLNLSGDPEQDYFADGLVEDIITMLTAVPWLFVIARNSSFMYRGSAVDVRRVGRELGVRYVLEGSVRKSGVRLRVSGQLIDCESGAHLWADRFDGTTDEVFDLQDLITQGVVCAIAPEIEGAEIARAAAKRPSSLSAYDHMLRAMACLNRAQVAAAVKHLEQALEAAPDYGKALGLRAWCCTLLVSWAAESDYEAARAEGLVLARRALAAAPNDPEVQAYAGYTLGFFGDDIDEGLLLIREAAERCPSFGWAWVSIGMLSSLQVEPDLAIEACARAKRLSPRDPMAFRVDLAESAAWKFAERYDMAAAAARRSLRGNPNLMPSHAYLVDALMALGELDAARAAAAELLARYPNFTIGRFHNVVRGARQYARLRQATEDRLRSAGLPD